jgi:streptomycin 6-kinase
MSLFFPIPPALNWLQESERGRQWLGELPARVARCVKKWALRLDSPYPQSFVSIVFPVTLSDGSAAVLKIQWPHPESAQEHEALRLWNGNGSVHLYAYDAQEHALLLERCEPGEHLSTIGEEQALEVFTEMLPRLWVPAGQPFRSLAEECREWQRRLPADWEFAGRPFERGLVDTALAAMESLSNTQGEQVLLHQDLHGDNVLSARREPWLAIDPKPLVGERELSLAPIIRSYEFSHSPADVIRRLDRLSIALRLDRERCRLWALVQTLAWGFESAMVYDKHVDTARWLWEAE